MQNGTNNDIQTARALFFEQLKIFEHAIPLYNISCCEALLGNSQLALEFLRKSIRAGYSEVDHIKNDEDLKSLRHLDEYKEIIRSLEPADGNSSNFSKNDSPSVPVSVNSTSVSIPLTKPVHVNSTSVSIPLTKPVHVTSDSAPTTVPVQENLHNPEVPLLRIPAADNVPQAPEPQQGNFRERLAALEQMGFSDTRKNVKALLLAVGDINVAVASLLQG